MLRDFKKFKYSRPKLAGNKTGAFYIDKNGQEWLIKSQPSLSCVEEAFAGALFTLFAGKEFVAETCLISDSQLEKFRVASRINSGYTKFNEATKKETDHTVLIDKRSIEGLELLVLVSALLQERDFYGNGNIGFDLSPADYPTPVRAFRIDFDDTLKSESFKSFQHYNSLGEFLKDLNA